MTKSTLFLLPPGFVVDGRREYCPECAELWGFLHYYPAIKEALDIRYVGFSHPRAAIVEMLGEGRWNCPTLVLADDAEGVEGVAFETANGRRHLGTARSIARYFAHLYGTPLPRGGD